MAQKGEGPAGNDNFGGNGNGFGAFNSNMDPTAFLQEFGTGDDGNLLNDFDFDTFLNTDDVNPGFDAASFFASGNNNEIETSTEN